ncbi:hypothetical protein [Fodinicurvata sediminis]|uniref:hypothetical protein n=1 Tax=Fodinicurvata sediminis TaxID=1121832 RepID=UPI0003B4A6D8|nr:hypothetical protein [Fodinicurvata sediminis]
MTSRTDIANRILVEVGASGTLTDLDQPSNENARILRAVWDSVLDEVLRAHPWTFANHRRKVAASANPPEFDWARAFPFPTDPYCLRVLRVNGRIDDYEISGRWILSDDPSPIRLKYTRRVTDPAEWDALFASAFISKVAACTAHRFTAKANDREKHEDNYARRIAEARTAAAQEGGARAPEHDELFLKARRS